MKKKIQACGSAAHEIARRQFLGGMMAGGTVIGGLSTFYTQEVLASLAKQQKRMIVVRMAGGLRIRKGTSPMHRRPSGPLSLVGHSMAMNYQGISTLSPGLLPLRWPAVG